MLFFSTGFRNLKQLRRLPGYDEETELFARALHSSLVGFIVGALFAPEAYQYFPYFAVAYTSVLLAIAKEQQSSNDIPPDSPKQKRQWSRAETRPAELVPVGGVVGPSARATALLRNQR